MVGARRGREPPPRAVGGGAAGGHAGDPRRRAQRAGALLHPARRRRVRHRPERPRLSHLLPRRGRRLRRDVRRRRHRVGGRLLRRPALSHADALAPQVARMTALARFPLRWASLLALILAWELTARAHVFTEFLLPSFSVVAARLVSDVTSGDLLSAIGFTLYRALAGFALAAAAGVAIGVLIARLPPARWFF